VQDLNRYRKDLMRSRPADGAPMQPA